MYKFYLVGYIKYTSTSHLSLPFRFGTTIFKRIALYSGTVEVRFRVHLDYDNTSNV